MVIKWKSVAVYQKKIFKTDLTLSFHFDDLESDLTIELAYPMQPVKAAHVKNMNVTAVN